MSKRHDNRKNERSRRKTRTKSSLYLGAHDILHGVDHKELQYRVTALTISRRLTVRGRARQQQALANVIGEAMRKRDKVTLNILYASKHMVFTDTVPGVADA